MSESPWVDGGGFGCVVARLVVRAGSLDLEVLLSHLLARDIGRLH